MTRDRLETALTKLIPPTLASDLVEHTAELGRIQVSSFGVDAVGELFVLDYAAGSLLRIAGPP